MSYLFIACKWYPNILTLIMGKGLLVAPFLLPSRRTSSWYRILISQAVSLTRGAVTQYDRANEGLGLR
jgi:hypothetical protein